MRHVINQHTVNTDEATHDAHALILGRTQTEQQALFRAASTSSASFITAAPHRPSRATARQAPV